jgi:hypothetical protein
VSAEEEMLAVIAAMDPQEATLALVQVLFVKVAEISGALDSLTPVIGAMAGRLGLNGGDLRRLSAMAAGIAPA